MPAGFNGYDPARGKAVVGIPTFIFWKDGKEVGRIPGDPGNDTWAGDSWKTGGDVESYHTTSMESSQC